MSRICTTCSKGSIMVGNYSNRVRATKFNPTGTKRKFPNLQWAKAGAGPRIKVCTTCMRKNKNLEHKG